MVLGGREHALSLLVQVSLNLEGWKGQYLCSW